MSILFSPIQLGALTLCNRIVVAPMCQYSAVDGASTNWHLMHLGNLAISGAGLLFIEATAVERDGRITPGCLGLWDDATEAALRPVMATIRQYAPVPVVMQLAHAGRKASSQVPWLGGQQMAIGHGGWASEAASAMPHKPGEIAPIALDSDGLWRIRAAFAAAATRAARLGIDAVELHAAHGYLLHQFLSPLANQRTDAYGGSLENRMRFPLEVFEAVRAAFPVGKPVGVRVSATDWVDGGWDLEQTIRFAKELQQRGLDWIDVSSGGASPQQKPVLGPGYQAPFAQAIKDATGITTMAVGLITEAQQAEDILARGQADLIALARAMLYDPRWPWHAAAHLGALVSVPPQYWRSPPREYSALFANTHFGAR